MTVPTMNKLSTVFPIMIEKYEQFIPNIEGMGVPDKINAIIQYLNRIGKLSNDVVADWNKVMVWVMDEGLTDNVNAKVDDLVAKGTFDALLNGMMDDLNTANTAFQNSINSQETTFQNTINGQVNTLTTQLAEKASKTDMRRFRPKFSQNSAFVGITSSNADKVNTLAQCKTEIDGYANVGIDEFALNVFINASGLDSNDWHVVNNISQDIQVIQYAVSKGIPCSTIRIFVNVTNIVWPSSFDQTFVNNYNAVFNTIVQGYKGQAPYMTVINEAATIYSNSTYTSFVTNLITTAKSNGFKAGVTFAGAYETYSCIPDILIASDMICANVYPIISDKGSNTTLQDSVNAWNADPVMNWIDDFSTMYPTKELWVSETGIMDYWEALRKPTAWDWGTQGYSEVGGVPVKTYFYGMFETLKTKNLKKVLGLYGINYPEMTKLCDYYLRGATSYE
jgi:hypothetical protein